MAKKILYKKDDLLGESTYHSDAMRDIAQKDQKKVVNQYQEKKQLFNALKKHRDGGITEKELKGVLADLKYGKEDHFTKKEVNDLARELGLGRIEKKDMFSQKLPHTSRLDRAQHVANFSAKDQRRSANRSLPSSDIVHHSASGMLKELLREKRRKNIVSGDLMFDTEEEDALYYDPRSGKRISQRTTQLKRPQFNIRHQSSLRGRGLIGGGKNF